MSVVTTATAFQKITHGGYQLESSLPRKCKQSEAFTIVRYDVKVTLREMRYSISRDTRSVPGKLNVMIPCNSSFSAHEINFYY